MAVVLGVDGGGTLTRMVAADLDGRVLAADVAQSINPDDHGEARATDVLRRASAALARRVGRERFDAAFLAVGGLLSERDREAMLGVATSVAVAPAGRIGVHHDAFAALEGGLLGAPGALLVAGTGSIVFGRDAEGREATCGDWGPLVGDEGSGHWLGREALRAVARAHDGRGPETALTRVVVARLGLDGIDDLLRRVHEPDVDRAAIAALAPDVVRSVDEGDAAATSILDRGCRELAHCVAVVAGRRFERTTVPLLVTGGLAKNGTYLRTLRRRIHERVPSVRFEEAVLPPVLGSVRLALAQAGRPATADVDARLARGREELPASF